MSYRTYTTDALVIGSFEHGSSDRTLFLFTREVGLVYARAVSVRKEVSKLRYALQDFSAVKCSLIRGKQGWRIIGAEQSENMYFSLASREARAALLRTIRLVRRFVRGEEAHVELYDILIDGIRSLSVCEGHERHLLENILTLRLLYVLGYIAPHARYRAYIDAPDFSSLSAYLGEDVLRDRAVRTAIDSALEVSHL